MRLRRLRWPLIVLFAAVLVVTFLGFDSLGADCGDAIQADGSETFKCNAPAYVVMGAGVIALAGLAAMLLWLVIDWFVARRAR
jgi:hypothetical protein